MKDLYAGWSSQKLCLVIDCYPDDESGIDTEPEIGAGSA